MKPGDKVWVLCEVTSTDECFASFRYGSTHFRATPDDCKLVEPEAVEQPVKKEPTEAQKIAERTLKAIWATHPKPEPEAVKQPIVETCSKTAIAELKQSLTDFPFGEPVVKQQPASDPVNPWHYKRGSIECIEAIKAALDSRFIGYLSGNILKYLWRWEDKNGIEDLKKARWYLDRLIQEEEAK